MTAVISLMLAVRDTPAAIAWYKQALQARVLWDMGSVAGLEIAGAPFFLHPPKQPAHNAPANRRPFVNQSRINLDQRGARGDFLPRVRRRENSANADDWQFALCLSKQMANHLRTPRL